MKRWTETRKAGGYISLSQEAKFQQYQVQNSASGLVVKSIVAIDGPRVRFAAGAMRIIFLQFCARPLKYFLCLSFFLFFFFRSSYN